MLADAQKDLVVDVLAVAMGADPAAWVRVRGSDGPGAGQGLSDHNLVEAVVSVG